MTGESVALDVGKRQTTTPLEARATTKPPPKPPVDATRSPATRGSG
jgi:hypothetical protein